MTHRNGHAKPLIDKRDFDANRPLLGGVSADGHPVERGPSQSRSRSKSPWQSANSDDSNGLLSDVVEGIVERDRRKMEREVVRVCSFAWGVITW